MSLTTQDKQNIRTIADEAVKNGIAHLPTVEVVRGIVKDEINDSMTSGPLKDAFTRIEEKINFGIYRVEVLYEDTRADIKAMAEMLSNNLKVNDRVSDHEYRLKEVEAAQPMIIKTLALHSKQLQG